MTLKWFNIDLYYICVFNIGYCYICIFNIQYCYICIFNIQYSPYQCIGILDIQYSLISSIFILNIHRFSVFIYLIHTSCPQPKWTMIFSKNLKILTSNIKSTQQHSKCRSRTVLCGMMNINQSLRRSTMRTVWWCCIITASSIYGNMNGTKVLSIFFSLYFSICFVWITSDSIAHAHAHAHPHPHPHRQHHSDPTTSYH